MNLTAATLRTFLARAMKVDEKYVLPKQGTWWNPQMLPTRERPITWCAYRMDNRPLTKPRYVDEEIDSARVNTVVVNMVATVTLQFVGADAENAAQRVTFWTGRADVAALLDEFDGRMFQDVDGPRPSDFYQDGANTVLAYNVVFRIVWASTIAADQELVTGAVIEGEVI